MAFIPNTDHLIIAIEDYGIVIYDIVQYEVNVMISFIE